MDLVLACVDIYLKVDLVLLDSAQQASGTTGEEGTKTRYFENGRTLRTMRRLLQEGFDAGERQDPSDDAAPSPKEIQRKRAEDFWQTHDEQRSPNRPSTRRGEDPIV